MIKQPILFLDVDGVLNSQNWFMSAEGKERYFVDDHRETHIDPCAIIFLNIIVRETDCAIVLSSTWRRGHSLGSTLRCFKRKGLRANGWNAFIGITPIMERQFPGSSILQAPTRGAEIQAWLNANGNPERNGTAICILDDESDMDHLKPFLVRTDIKEGLTLTKTKEVIAKLTNPERVP
jgi:hypothetical protein